MQLQMEDAENNSRRNNIRLKGIHEATMGADLRILVAAILNQLLSDPPSVIEIDRVHRVPASRAASQETPRDVLCQVHYFHG